MEQSEQQEVKTEAEDVEMNEILKCDQCEKIFAKKGQKSLHMRKVHNMKTMQYTPAPRKVGRPAYRFMCELCNEKKKAESELKSHMTIRHARVKRDLTDMRQGTVQRTISLALSPPNKKTKSNQTNKTTNVEDTVTKDDHIKNLQTINATLTASEEKSKEVLTRQVKFIDELTLNLNKLKAETEGKNTEIK